MIVDREIFKGGRLTVRTTTTDLTAEQQPVGTRPLQLDHKRDGFLYVPKTYSKDKPASLAAMLHGAGGQAGHGLSILKSYADDHNMILLAPASRFGTWDIIAQESFGADVIFIDQALQIVFERHAINKNKIAIGGFSDGASYALCLGISNGDLFTHILAFSPGFSYAIEKQGKPKVFISHGISDGILPIDACSRRIVKQLQKEDYPVVYKEFKGAHEIPATISKAAVALFVKGNE